MLNISITTVPQNQMDYATVGDYKGHKRRRFIEVAELKDWRWEFLIGYHELIEQNLQISLGISEESIVAWDLAHPDSDDPGNLPGCPYGDIHKFAEHAEKDMCIKCGWSWEEYCNTLDRHNLHAWQEDNWIKTSNLS
jgi:hypothetical protein